MSQRIERSNMLGFRHYLWLIINGCGSRNKYINVILRFTPFLSIGRFRKEEIYSDTPNNENIHLTTVDRVCSIRRELAIWKQMYSEIDKRSLKKRLRGKETGRCSSAKRHCLLSLILHGSNDIVHFCFPRQNGGRKYISLVNTKTSDCRYESEG